MLTINIKTLPHKEQRYPTCGDWFWEGKILNIRISEMPDWRYEFLIAFHELFEAMWCAWKGIKEQDVTDFDLIFERERADGSHKEEDEPGDDPRAPYKEGHFMATHLEAIAAFCLGVDWKAYEDAVSSL